MTAVIGGCGIPRDAWLMATNSLSSAAILDDSIAYPVALPAPRTVSRLRPIMRQGTASSVAETWTRFATLDDARRAAKSMYHDDRVLRVFVVTDDVPPQFVEWVER